MTASKARQTTLRKTYDKKTRSALERFAAHSKPESRRAKEQPIGISVPLGQALWDSA